MIKFVTNQKITIAVSIADKNVCGTDKQKPDYKKFLKKLINMPDTKKETLQYCADGVPFGDKATPVEEQKPGICYGICKTCKNLKCLHYSIINQ